MKKLFLALDIGNVCIKIDRSRCLDALGLADFTDDMLTLARDFEWGKTGQEDFFKSFVSLLPERKSFQECLNAFNSILVEPVPGMCELVKEFISLGVTPVFFSDISPTHLAQTRKIFAASELIPDGVYSFEVGAWKPSIEMFSAFEKRFDVPILYTDDREELIEGALTHGWNAVRFTDAEKLAETLNNALKRHR